MDSLVADQPFIADLDPDGIEENKWIDWVQWTLLPGGNFIEIILSSKPGKRRWYLAINCGSKLPARSRGTSISIFPVPVETVLRP